VTPAGSFRARVVRRRASHSHGVVLLLIVAAFLFAATASDASWTYSVLVLLQSLTLVAALWTSGIAKLDSPLSLAFLLIAIGLAVANLLATSNGLTGAVSIVSGGLVLGIAFVIAVSVASEREVNGQSIIGAICVYILLGLMFLFLYGAIATLGPGPFFAQGMDGSRALRLYFSYVTLATLGYGDYTPRTDLGHTTAVVEALLGQLYLVTVVALLVARMRTRREPT
jgi:hypothetical protein